MKQVAILIRHGESESNIKGLMSEDVEGYPLTETGIRQVEHAASELKKINVDRIISSPVLRARQTAGIIASALNLKVELDEGIRESGHGPYNNKHSNLVPYGKRENLGMESFDKIKERTMESLKNYEGVNVFVSHALPIKAVVSDILSLDEEESRGIKLSNASITIIDLQSRNIISIGSREITPHIVETLQRP